MPSKFNSVKITAVVTDESVFTHLLECSVMGINLIQIINFFESFYVANKQISKLFPIF